MDKNSSIHVTPPTAIPKPVREHSPTPLEAETTTPTKRPQFILSTSESHPETPTSIIIPPVDGVLIFYQAMKNILLYIVFLLFI